MHPILHRGVLLVFLIGLSLFSEAQMPIGSWRLHFPYALSTGLTLAGDAVYSTSGNGLFRRNADGSIDILDKNNGLSDIGIVLLRYDDFTDYLIIGYQNGNIDLLKDNRVINIRDIRNEIISAGKQLNHVFFDGGKAYLSTGFGMVVLDLERLEIEDTYFLAEDAGFVNVNGAALLKDSLYAATDEGLRVVPFNSSVNRADAANWQTQTSAQGLDSLPVTELERFGDHLYCIFNDSLMEYTDGQWTLLRYNEFWQTRSISVTDHALSVSQQRDSSGVVSANRILTVESAGSISSITNSGFARVVDAYVEADFSWISDEFLGLLFLEEGVVTPVVPNGPRDKASHSINNFLGRTYVAAGSVDNTFAPEFDPDGIFLYDQGFWSNFNQFTQFNSGFESFLDILSSRGNVQTGEIYLGSGQDGFAIWDGQQLEIFDETNSSIRGIAGNEGTKSITDIKIDAQGVVWMANYGSGAPYVAYDPSDDEWYSFASVPGNNLGIKLLIDSYGNKWMATRGPNQSLLVFNENGTLGSTGDDQLKVLRGGQGNGDLPNNEVLSIVEDLDRNVWVGTAEGIAVFYCASRVLDDGCDAQRIIVERDGFNGFLFETEIIRALAVDGANRKWVGTTSGLWLISADGQEEIHYFNSENSPLPSDIINDISINPESGEVFVSTQEGIVSYLSDATAGGSKHENVLVYPNPVRPGYDGPIAIKGLVQDASVKITDIAGTLVYETTALGGQAVWDGRDYNGLKAAKGVYFVLSSSDDGKEAVVAKILLMN